jgi:hypothetical protein
MKFILKYKDGTIKEVSEKIVIYDMYWKLAVFPSYKEINKNKAFIQKMKDEVSKLRYYIPMFDINSKNLHIITPDNLKKVILDQDYRLVNENNIIIIKLAMKKINKANSYNKDVILHKLEKNVNFLECFNLDILTKTFNSLIKDYKDEFNFLTDCIKPSYFPYLKYINPYYTKKELFCMYKNMNIRNKSKDLCKLVSDYDISYFILLKHYIYLKKNFADSYIELYSLLGAFYINDYLRYESLQDIFLEKIIDNLYSIIKKAPAFDKDYYVYRLVEEDSFLKHLKINDIFTEKGLLSVSRNQFYDYRSNVFGLCLMRIKLPKNVQGIGICIENISLFPEEQEILLGPAKLRLKQIDDDFKYYHIDDLASQKIKKKYDFEYVQPNPIKFKYGKSIDIIHLDFQKLKVDGKSYLDKINNFYKNYCTSLNTHKYFYANIKNKKYLFQVFILESTRVYDKYFFLQNSKDKQDLMYILQQDVNTGKINLLIEIKDIISLNYIFKYIGSNNIFKTEDLLDFVSDISAAFDINNIIIHSDYTSYTELTDNNLNKFDITVNRILNEDYSDIHIQNLYTGYYSLYPTEIIEYLISHSNYYSNLPFKPKFKDIKSFIRYDILDLFIDLKTELVLKDLPFSLIVKIFNKKQYILLVDFYLLIHFEYYYLLDDLNCIINNYFIKVYNLSLYTLFENYYYIISFNNTYSNISKYIKDVSMQRRRRIILDNI